MPVEHRFPSSMEVLKQLQRSLAQAFDGSFDDAYRDLHAELAARDARIEELERKINLADEARTDALIRVEQLQREVSTLREELDQGDAEPTDLEASKADLPALSEMYAPEHVLGLLESTGLDNPDTGLQERKKALEETYRALYRDMLTLAGATTDLVKQAKRNKMKLKQWQDRVKCDEFKLVLNDGVRVHFKRFQAASNDYLGKQQESSLTMGSRNKPTKSNSSTSRASIEGGSKEDRTGAASNQLSAIACTRSDTSSTEDEHPSHNHSSNITFPAVAPSLKRKRPSLSQHPFPSSPGYDLSENGNSRRPVLIKNETVSSSPLHDISQYRATNPTGTQDLDEIGSTVETPTKRRTHDVGQSVQKDLATVHGHVSTSGQEKRVRHQRLPPEPKSSRSVTVLQPVDKNVQPLYLLSETPNVKKRKSLRGATRRIPTIAEDGDESYLDVGRDEGPRKLTPTIDAGQLSSTAEHNPIRQRLENLLEGPSTSKRPLNLGKDLSREANAVKHGSRGSGSPENGTLATRHNANLVDVVASQGPSSHSMTEPEMRNNVNSTNSFDFPHPRKGLSAVLSGSRPCRVRPVEELDLGCFKLNPESNQGVDFAYNAVVRNKDERKHLAGCTRPECCGEKFRVMARLGGLPIKPGSSVKESSPGAERDILEEYLGDAKHLLARASEKTRKDFLDEARARLLADQYGKHRHQHQRARSPPGFWRTEMPDTQELQQDREEAKRLEREKIMERYREAMCPRGLWKFADE